jgi:hypothetical protein
MNSNSAPSIFLPLVLVIVVLVGGGYKWSQLDNVRKEKAALEQNLTQKESDLTVANEAISGLNGQMAQMKQDNQKLQNALKDEQRQHNLDTETAQTCVSDRNNFISERDRLNQELGSTTKQRDAMLEQFNGASSERDTLKTKLSNVTTESDALREKLIQITQERDILLAKMNGSEMMVVAGVSQEQLIPNTGEKNHPSQSAERTLPIFAQLSINEIWWAITPILLVAIILLFLFITNRFPGINRRKGTVAVYMTREQARNYSRYLRNNPERIETYRDK